MFVKDRAGNAERGSRRIGCRADCRCVIDAVHCELEHPTRYPVIEAGPDPWQRE